MNVLKHKSLNVNHVFGIEVLCHSIKNRLDSYMVDNGYTYNRYFAYLNMEHPLYLAFIGKLDLSPETFKLAPLNQIIPLEKFTDIPNCCSSGGKWIIVYRYCRGMYQNISMLDMDGIKLN